MNTIGKKLADKRKELKLSYEDVSKMTKLSITHIKAIEQGDLDYFRNDLTYVRFYVRSYCKAIDVPYENFKDDLLDSVDEYSTTMAMKVIKEQEEVDKKISERTASIPKAEAPQLAQKDRSSIKQNVKQSSRFKKKKIDVAFLSLIVVIVLVVGIVLYVGGNALINKLNEEPPKEDPTQDVTPKPEEDKKDNEDKNDKDTKEEDSKVAMTLKPNSTYQYEIGGIKAGENFKLEITFKAAGSFNLWQGQTSVPNAYGVYQAGATYTLEAPVQANMTYTANFWNYAGATFKINGKTVEFDANAGLKQEGVTFIEFSFKGE